MENYIVIAFILLAVYILLQTPMFYRSRETNLEEDRPVTWTTDWAGGHGFSRFQIDGQIS